MYYDVKIVSSSNYRLIILYSDDERLSRALSVVYVKNKIILFDSIFGIFEFENEKDLEEFIKVLKKLMT